MVPVVIVQICNYLNIYDARLSSTQVKQAGYLSSEELTCYEESIIFLLV